jgi:hypothetical protein
MSASTVTAVETNRMTSQQMAYLCGNGNATSSQQQMEMIGYQRPSVATGAGFFKYSFQPVHKRVAVFVVFEDLGFFDTASNDMM